MGVLFLTFLDKSCEIVQTVVMTSTSCHTSQGFIKFGDRPRLRIHRCEDGYLEFSQALRVLW